MNAFPRTWIPWAAYVGTLALCLGCDASGLTQPGAPIDGAAESPFDFSTPRDMMTALDLSYCVGLPGCCGSGVSIAGAPTPTMTVVDGAGIAPSEMILWLALQPPTVLADGQSQVAAVATVTDHAGRRLRGVDIRFLAQPLGRAPDGTYWQGCDEAENGVPYSLIPSCMWLLSPRSLTNIVKVTTDASGQATAMCQAPQWTDVLAQLSELIVVNGPADPSTHRAPYTSALLGFTHP
jgi:hypothetical protein